MVLINDKKFACATCIKGHRVSGCTHTDRPLFEVKKKGRPATQCSFCKEKRKGSTSTGAVHTKCACGDPQAPNVIMPSSSNLNASSSSRSAASSSDHSPTPTPLSPENDETRKGRPGSKATFPNGLRDVHEQSLGGTSGEEAFQAAERSVQNLLNPCHCKTTGICKCCKPKTERRSGPQSSASPSSCCSTGDGRLGTDTLVELYKTKAHNAEASSSRRPSLQPPDISPNSHAHRTAHRAKLYSPYTTPRHTSKSPVATPSSSSHPLPIPSRLRPLADMSSFLGAVFNQDGSIASEISRSALGLPGITTFDSKAAEGGVKVEAMEIDDNEPVAFPTSEDVIIGACTCGPDCDCPGCSIHGNAPGGDHGPEHTACGHRCKSSFDCTNHLAIPSGATSVEHLLSLAAANVPPPPRMNNDLDAHNTRIIPPASALSPDAALQLGIVQLKPLECCNGRCQCAPGSCSCEKDCCGCCIRCACAEDGEGDSNMNQNRRESAGQPSGCCSGPTTTTIPTGGHARNPSLSVTAPLDTDCCGSSSGTGSGHSPNPSLSFSSADEYFRPSPTLSHHSPRPSLNISTAADGTMPPFNLDSAGSMASTTLGVNQPTPPLLSPGSARTTNHGIPLLSPESARHPGGSSPSSPHSPHSPRSPRSSRSSLKGRKSAQSSRSSTPSHERDDGEPATKRRASFTQQGNAAQDGNESRRATIATHSATPSLSRSASTGKASSKALALNTQPNHPSHRNSNSKANSSSSGHLLPPKPGAPTSPHRRRASSGTGHHSPRTVTPEPRSPSSHGHSASLGHAPVDFQPSQLMPSLQQYSNDQQPPQINIDSVNDDEEFVPDADLLAYINQLTSSSAGTSDVSSIPTNYNFDFINPFDQAQQSMQNGGNQDVNMGMGMGSNGTISTGDFLSMLGTLPQQQPLQMPPSTSNFLSQSMSGLYLGQPRPPPMVMSDMGYDPSQSQSQSQPRSRDPMHNEYAYMQQQHPQMPQDPNKMYNPNPNLIDLSKPLDAGDVERILRALQDQQSQQQQQQQPPPQPQQQQQPPPPPQQQMQRPPLQMQLPHMSRPQMMLPQHPPMPQYNMQQPPPPPPQDDLFDKFMLDPSPSAPETSTQSGFDFNQMYGGVNPNHVHMSMLQQQASGMNGNGNPQNGVGNGQNGEQLTWEQLRLWAASHGMQAPPGPM